MMPRGRRHVDYAHVDQRAMKAALAFRPRGEVGIAAFLKQAGAGGKNLVKRQPGLLQCGGPEKSNIEAGAAPGDKPIGTVVQGLDGIERAELTPRVRRKF